MNLYCFPRLEKAPAKLWAENFANMMPDEVAAERPEGMSDEVSFSPTGAPKVPDLALAELREKVLKLAKASGYPHRRSIDGQRDFDLELARYLYDLPIIPGDAWRDEVWNFLGCRLLPDVVVWRFSQTEEGRIIGKTSLHRFLGGNRNTFQRLWLRARLLYDATADDGFWLLNTRENGLSEDNFTQLIERGAGLGGYSHVSRALAVEFVRFRDSLSSASELTAENLMREAAKRALRIMAFANLDAISEEQRLSIIRGFFREIIQAKETKATPPSRVYDCFVMKTLRSIDLPNSSKSNQHEIQGLKAIRELLGESDQYLDCHWRGYNSNGAVSLTSTTMVRWYDARAAHPTRNEWRLYYPAGTPLEQAKVDDMLLLATSLHDEKLHAFVLPRGELIYLKVRGALELAGVSRVPDNIEEYIRTILQ